MTATTPKKKRYEVLMGSHFEPTGAMDAEGRPVMKQYRMGDIVETDTPLCSEFNEHNKKGKELQGPQKFRDVTHAGPTQIKDTEQLAGETPAEWLARLKDAISTAEKVVTGSVPPTPPNNIDGMSVKELQALAEESEIDLKGETKKEAIIKILRAKK